MAEPLKISRTERLRDFFLATSRKRPVDTVTLGEIPEGEASEALRDENGRPVKRVGGVF